MDELSVVAWVLLAPFAAMIGVHVFVLIDIFRTPPDRWRAIGRSKYGWIAFVWYSLGIGAVLYLVRVRPVIREHDSDPAQSGTPAGARL